MGRVIRRVRTAACLAGPLLLAVACGSEEADEPVRAARLEAAGHFDTPLPAPGTSRVEFANGRVRVHSNGAQRLEILKQLAEQAGFELLEGKLERLALTLRIEDATLPEALGTLLSGVPYSVEYDTGSAAGSHVIRVLLVGQPVSVAELPPPQGERQPGALRRVEESDSENARRSSVQQYVDQVRERISALSPEERQRMHEELFARAEAREPELLQQLGDLDPEQRADAVASLPVEGQGSTGAERFQRMASLLADDPDRRVRIAAAERLGEVESPEAVNALAKALSDPDQEVVLAAIEALGDADDVSAIPYLEVLLLDPNEEVRGAAEFAIEYLKW